MADLPAEGLEVPRREQDRGGQRRIDRHRVGQEVVEEAP